MAEDKINQVYHTAIDTRLCLISATRASFPAIHTVLVLLAVICTAHTGYSSVACCPASGLSAASRPQTKTRHTSRACHADLGGTQQMRWASSIPGEKTRMWATRVPRIGKRMATLWFFGIRCLGCEGRLCRVVAWTRLRTSF